MAVRRPVLSFIYAIARRLGFSLHRWPSTRFDSMDDGIELLSRAGFRPDVVIDVGANNGIWTAIARRFFPDAVYHLVEPQSGCLRVLRALAARTSNVRVYDTAVTRPGVSTVVMAGGGTTQDGGGHFVLDPSAPAGGIETTTHPAATLDELFGRLEASHMLVKLDVEEHELAVIEGASVLLAKAEVVVTEFWMPHPSGRPMPTLSQLAAALEALGFAFYDITALNGSLRTRRLVSGDAIFVRRSSPLFSHDQDQ